MNLRTLLALVGRAASRTQPTDTPPPAVGAVPPPAKHYHPEQAEDVGHEPLRHDDGPTRPVRVTDDIRQAARGLAKALHPEAPTFPPVPRSPRPIDRADRNEPPTSRWVW